MAKYQTLGALLERHAATYAEKTYLYWKDAQIAEHLVISPRTVNCHTTSL